MNVPAIPSEWHNAKRVSFDAVRRRLDVATLSERNALLDFIRANIARIRPSIDDDWLYDSMTAYFLDCIARPVDSFVGDDSVHSRFEAARELIEWLNWIVTQDNNPTEIQKRIDRIAIVFKNGDTSVRNCIETGFLEHVLEIPRNRPYFAHWKDDVILADSYTEALRWSRLIRNQMTQNNALNASRNRPGWLASLGKVNSRPR